MKEILITSSVLIGAILLARWLFRDKVSRRLIYAAWLLVALRLLIPVQFGQLNFSILTAAKPMTEAITQISDQQVAGVTEKEAYHQVVGNYIENDREVFMPEVKDHIQSAIDNEIPNDEIVVMIDKVYSNEEIFIPEVQENVQQEMTQIAEPITLGQIARFVWILGIAVMAVWFAAVNLHHHHLLRKGAEKMDCDSPIPVYVAKRSASPCLVGLFKPVIYLTPASITEPESLLHILTHEQTHYAHKDHIWSLVRCVCLCIYWFDPLVWVAAYISRQDCEMACDEGAMKRLGAEDRLAYGKTLLGVVTQAAVPGKLLHTATSMNETKKQLKQRISLIAKKPKLSIIATICMVLVCAIVAGCAAGGAQSGTTPETTEQKPNSWEVSDEFKLQIKQDYLEYMAFSNHSCSVDDVQLGVVSHIESGYVVLISCACGSVKMDDSWDSIFGTLIGDYEFFMPSSWFMQLYADGEFYMLEAAYNLQKISDAQVESTWKDFYAQFPQAREYYKQRYPDNSPDRLEEKLLMQYNEIVEFLHKYDPSDPQKQFLYEHATNTPHRSQAALRFCYRWLTEHKEVDEWTDYCTKHGVQGYEYNRKVLLDHFTTIKDVKLEATQYLAHVTNGYMTNGTHLWYYDEHGRLGYEELNRYADFDMVMYVPKDFQSGGDYLRFYDENGRIYRISGQGGYYTYIPNYDAAGKISSMTVQVDSKMRLIQYTYDEKDRLVRLEISGSTLPSSNYLIEYSYDDYDNLIKKVQSYFTLDYRDHTHSTVITSNQKVTEYRYDSKNVLKEASYIEISYNDNQTKQTRDEYTFSYDEQGRLVRYDISFDDPYYNTGYTEITYGDFLYYSAG